MPSFSGVLMCASSTLFAFDLISPSPSPKSDVSGQACRSKFNTVALETRELLN